MKYDHWLPKLLKVNAIVLNKVIYFARPIEKVSARLMKHEKVHVRQQAQEGLLFYFKYILEWLWNIPKYNFDTQQAYRQISYEIEARIGERR